MKDESLSTREMLLNIAALRKLAYQFAKKDKAYSALLILILDMDFYYGDGTLPSLKELVSKSGLTISKVRKQIEEIYSDLVLNKDLSPIFSFQKVRFEFYIRGWRKNKFINFEANSLPVIPRVGEEISIPFFSAYMEVSSFFVEQVRYEFEDEMQIVNIWLRAGSYNSYWQFVKDKAIEEEILPFSDWLNLEEYELKKKLKVGR